MDKVPKAHAVVHERAVVVHVSHAAAAHSAMVGEDSFLLVALLADFGGTNTMATRMTCAAAWATGTTTGVDHDRLCQMIRGACPQPPHCAAQHHQVRAQ